jgi:DNA-binding CsgD family transcriptional regulator
MTAPALLELCHRLVELPDRTAFIRAAVAEVALLWRCDNAYWMEVDFARRSSVVRHGPDGDLDPALSDLLAEADDHPAIRSYVDEPTDLSPRRLSDVGRRYGRPGDAVREITSRIGRHQLTMIVSLESPIRGRGWLAARSARDFTDEELALARSALPMLTALDRMYRRLPSLADGDSVEEARLRAGLTVRERDILQLVASGLTTDAIGRALHISPRTVSKHLEHTYAKLGCRDRLSATNHASRHGLLKTPNTLPSVLGPYSERPRSVSA